MAHKMLLETDHLVSFKKVDNEICNRIDFK